MQNGCTEQEMCSRFWVYIRDYLAKM